MFLVDFIKFTMRSPELQNGALGGQFTVHYFHSSRSLSYIRSVESYKVNSPQNAI
jgi:hypothetical protein